MTTTSIKQKMHKAPVHSPNEFHLGENGELIQGLGETQFPARVQEVTPQELANLADREEAIANAEDRIEGMKAEALVLIEQQRLQLETDRAEFEKEKAAANSAKTTKPAGR